MESKYAINQPEFIFEWEPPIELESQSSFCEQSSICKLDAAQDIPSSIKKKRHAVSVGLESEEGGVQYGFDFASLRNKYSRGPRS